MYFLLALVASGLQEVTVPGWIGTMLAVGLGAPFWFGLLQQLTNIRSSGPAPARAGANGGGGQP